MGVVVRRYMYIVDILTIIINFPYSTCISSFFVHLKNIFSVFIIIESVDSISRDAAAKKRANTSGVGKINNYCEDIYIPP